MSFYLSFKCEPQSFFKILQILVKKKKIVFIVPSSSCSSRPRNRLKRVNIVKLSQPLNHNSTSTDPNRLKTGKWAKKILLQVIPETQFAFVLGRLIVDKQ